MVYEYRSFSLAAKRLFVTQSTISKRIAKLENEFKTKLFETRGGRIFPTIEGQLLAPSIRLLLHTMHNAADNIKNPELAEIPVFLGTSLYPSLRFLPHFFHYLSEKKDNFPRFHIKQIARPDILQILSNGIIDLAITTQSFNIDKGFIHHPLIEEKLVIAVSPKHPLANEKNIDIKLLSNYSCILPEQGFTIRDSLEQVFYKKDLPLLINHELSSLDSIAQLVKIGLDWSVLPKQYCDQGLTGLTVKGFSEKITISCYYHEERADSKIIKYSEQLLKESIGYFKS
ncbi:HTH-type transcriptional activator CmpR [Legionella massiliensis]|uniref:HTH-type transcriptional activator CmpR n=1 Tax=Legionella massiliensis TaxID=1034943 RepID=A0A078KYR2_9GAMM|nr:LysR family transcriptional regulator [Legionella massiliensis]CDZ76863.1 HTH-type transcriptional activator CmpR [Legionella massiliensis]CEE12601.1 HTH-type transcriptional activator CmpR [Legionella massiliensis]